MFHLHDQLIRLMAVVHLALLVHPSAQKLHEPPAAPQIEARLVLPVLTLPNLQLQGQPPCNQSLDSCGSNQSERHHPTMFCAETVDPIVAGKQSTPHPIDGLASGHMMAVLCHCSMTRMKVVHQHSMNQNEMARVNVSAAMQSYV
jgi:hypothetical protein